MLRQVSFRGCTVALIWNTLPGIRTSVQLNSQPESWSLGQW
jgi:hypothetical protein